MALSLGVCGPVWAQNVQAKDLMPNATQSAEPSGKPSVGMIKVVTGLVNLQTADGKNKFAGAGTKLNVGDIINTQAKSTTVLEFVDTTQVALRPNTRFVVENYEYQPEQPIADKAEFKLVKGGLRTLTGLIGKRGSADAFSMKSETATIGIRGTGCYIEASPKTVYFCLCYGTADIKPLANPGLARSLTTTYHDMPMYISYDSSQPVLRPAPVINHRDSELVLLEETVGRQPPFVQKPAQEPSSY